MSQVVGKEHFVALGFSMQRISLYEVSSAFQKLSLDMKDIKASDLCPSITASLILEISKAGAESWTLIL